MILQRTPLWFLYLIDKQIRIKCHFILLRSLQPPNFQLVETLANISVHSLTVRYWNDENWFFILNNTAIQISPFNPNHYISLLNLKIVWDKFSSCTWFLTRNFHTYLIICYIQSSYYTSGKCWFTSEFDRQMRQFWITPSKSQGNHF